jgi:HD superfamily phosphodiesterase
MNENTLELGKKFLASYLKGKEVDYETFHPWRNNWEFVLLHSFRVESYVKKILAMEKHSLSPNETLIIRLAAILHDIGRIITRENHAKLSRNIISEWLSTEGSIRLTKEETSKLLYLIEKHSDKEDGDEDYSLKVVRDADILDEIGAISIFMAANWIDKKGNNFLQ